MRNKFFGVMVLLVAILVGYQYAWSQAETGSVTGTVTDQTGAVVPGASVTAKSVATSAERTIQTTSDGTYVMPGLAPGLYDVTVTSQSFAPFTSRVEVTVGGKVTLDAQLEVGKTTTVVEVVGQGGAVVNTQSQELSQIVNTEQIGNLPSLTRNPYDFVALSGDISSGDQTSNGGSPNNTGSSSGQSVNGRGVGFSINGQRESGTEILLDGVENETIFTVAVGTNIPVDSIQEFSVLTNNFSAEYGRASGGVVNVASKSGTNQIHGSAWEYNRLSAYTANTFENNANDIPKGKYTRNQFGYAAGGPIVKNKLFVFESTEWTRVRSAAPQTEEVFDPSFTALLPAGTASYFSKFATGALPSSGTVTYGQLAAAGTTFGPINGTTPISPSQPVFDIVNFRAPFDAGGDVPQNTYRLLGRMDYNLNDSTQMFFRYARENQANANGSVAYSPYPQYDVGYAGLHQGFLYSLNHVFTPNVLNSAKVSFDRFYDVNSFDTALTFTPNLYINSGSPADPVTGNLIQMPGLENTGPGSGGLPFGGWQNTLQFVDDVSWTKGKHTMKFGGQLTYIQLNYAYGAYQQAVEQLATGLDDGLNALVNAPGNPNGSPLIGFTGRVAPNALPCTAQPQYWNTGSRADLNVTPACTVTPPLAAADPARSYRYHDWALYGQDSFRITPRLTLNYGLRWEHYGVQHNNHQNLDSNFYFGSGATLYDRVASGGVDITTKSPTGQFWAPNWGTFGPRVGFAYDLTGDGKTSLRGGFGISYERNFGNVTFNASFNPPASAAVEVKSPKLSSTTTNVITVNDSGPLGLPGPSQPLPPSSLRMPDPNINTAQVQFWSLSLEREIAPNTLVELDYSGAHGVHLYDLENVNLIGAANFYQGINPESPACAGEGTPNGPGGNPICLVPPNEQYSAINMRGTLGSSAYDALNVKFQTQDIHHTGLSLVANYTWAHSLDDLSSTFGDDAQGGSGYIGSLGYTNALTPLLDWGNSNYDVRHRIVISPIWATPWFRNSGGWEGQALGGWTISSIFTAHTGIPFSVFDYSNSFNFYTAARLTPATPITDYHTGALVPTGAPGVFTAMTLPVPASSAPLDPALGISDFGPYPKNMTRRNAFRGPGAWNDDLRISKTFKLTERFGLQFNAEGFNVFNHANTYIFLGNLGYFGAPYAPLTVSAYKGGLGSLALGGNHDERRFGQFSLQLNF
ncbi:MAG TPA: TonB-dependent receptor [Candidatus Acidoferrales bacterium]|nr:TonB-dependent receptor [Candidatus Acidoferrales bacterium]